MVGRGKVGRDRGGLMHTQFIRWLELLGGGRWVGIGVVKGILNSVFNSELLTSFT